jgi:hypothetical protein
MYFVCVNDVFHTPVYAKTSPFYFSGVQCMEYLEYMVYMEYMALARRRLNVCKMHNVCLNVLVEVCPSTCP